MSLIGDALKEASRERTAQAIRPTKPLAPIVVPNPRVHARRRSRAVATLGISLATGASVVVGAMAFALQPGPTSTSHESLRNLPVAPNVSATQRAVVAPPPTMATVPISQAPSAPTIEARPAPRVDSVVKPVAVKSNIASSPRSASSTSATVASVAQLPAIGIVQQGSARPVPAPVAGIVQQGSARPVPAPVPGTPRTADSLFKLAYAAHVADDLDVAYALYEKTIATQHAPAAAYNDYGALLKQRGDLSAAIAMFRQAIAHDDTNVDAWVNLGDMLDAAGEHTDALSAFARATSLDPARITIKSRLASQYQALGDTSTARQFFEDAVRLEPNEAGAHYALGLFLQSQRELPAAIREYQRFVDLAGGKYSASVVTDVKQHIVALRKFVP